MEELIKTSVGAVIYLNDMMNKLSVKRVKNADGTEVDAVRPMPFATRYKINRNLIVLQNAVNDFVAKREAAKAEILNGTTEPSDEQSQAIVAKVQDLLKDEVILDIYRFNPEELNYFGPVEDDLFGLDNDAMQIFASFFTIDQQVMSAPVEKPKAKKTSKKKATN